MPLTRSMILFIHHSLNTESSSLAGFALRTVTVVTAGSGEFSFTRVGLSSWVKVVVWFLATWGIPVLVDTPDWCHLEAFGTGCLFAVGLGLSLLVVGGIFLGTIQLPIRIDSGLVKSRVMPSHSIKGMPSMTS